MRKNIEVKDEEIFIARRGVKTRCAIVAAIMLRVPAARHIKVDQNTISWLDTERRERLIFRTPESAAAFIDRWDREEEVEPISFSLTDSLLIERRRPKEVSRLQRLTRAPQGETKNPGSRIARPLREQTCETGE
jgi:hypothetical protein